MENARHKNILLRIISLAIIFAVIFMMSGFIMMQQVNNLYADEKAKVYLWLQVKWESGNPLPGQPGDLFNQLELVIKYKGKTIYNGPMDGLVKPKEFTNLVGKLEPGDTFKLDYSVYLPGHETGNEFQGSNLATSFLVQTQCITPDGKDVILTPIVQPNRLLFNLNNLNPGDKYENSLIIKLPELPETATSEKIVEILGIQPFLEVLAFTGISPYIILVSLVLIISGLILLLISKKGKNRISL